MKELIKAQDEYIKLLNDELCSLSQHLFVYNIKASPGTVAKTEELSAKIKSLKESISPPSTQEEPTTQKLMKYEVEHLPSGERWVALHMDRKFAYIAGWPSTVANINNLKIIKGTWRARQGGNRSPVKRFRR